MKTIQVHLIIWMTLISLVPPLNDIILKFPAYAVELFSTPNLQSICYHNLDKCQLCWTGALKYNESEPHFTVNGTPL